MAFWRIAMRPGKPMMHGRLGAMRVIGLPGNPGVVLCLRLPVSGALIRARLGAMRWFSTYANRVSLTR